MDREIDQSWINGVRIRAGRQCGFERSGPPDLFGNSVLKDGGECALGGPSADDLSFKACEKRQV
jgi:hypothetical protein